MNMVPEFISRKQGKTKIVYELPELEAILKETYGVISPLLANLFLHYAFDTWMKRQYPCIPFERYADDGIYHWRSKAGAEGLRVSIERRFAECGLELNLQKTKIVYCKDDNRRGEYPEQKFDFLGFTFRPRRAKNRLGRFFVAFIPAISNKAGSCKIYCVKS